jgi:hypothetical protein
MVWPASKQQAGGDQAEAKQHNVVKEVNSGTPFLMYQLPFHSLPPNKVKNIEVDRLRLSFTTPRKLVPVDSDEESDDDQECSDHICSGLHAIPRKNKSRSTKKRVRKASYKEYYKIFH